MMRMRKLIKSFVVLAVRVKVVNVSMSGRTTRYRAVVLTSWDRGMSDCERDPPATARWY